jgi:hypothetical protein
MVGSTSSGPPQIGEKTGKAGTYLGQVRSQTATCTVTSSSEAGSPSSQDPHEISQSLPNAPTDDADASSSVDNIRINPETIRSRSTDIHRVFAPAVLDSDSQSSDSDSVQSSTLDTQMNVPESAIRMDHYDIADPCHSSSDTDPYSFHNVGNDVTGVSSSGGISTDRDHNHINGTPSLVSSTNSLHHADLTENQSNHIDNAQSNTSQQPGAAGDENEQSDAAPVNSTSDGHGGKRTSNTADPKRIPFKKRKP